MYVEQVQIIFSTRALINELEIGWFHWEKGSSAIILFILLWLQLFPPQHFLGSLKVISWAKTPYGRWDWSFCASIRQFLFTAAASEIRGGFSVSVNQSRAISSDEAWRIHTRGGFPLQAGEKTGCCCLLCVSFRMQVPDVGMETAGAVALSNF